MNLFRRLSKVCLITILVIAPACSVNKVAHTPTETDAGSLPTSPSAVQSTPPDPTSIPTQTPPATPTGDLTSQTGTTNYQLNVSLNFDERSLSVYQTIDYTNCTGGPLDELLLIVPPAQSEDAFSLISLQVDPTYGSINTRMENGVIYVQPDPTLEPGQQFKLTLLFQLHPQEGEGAFGYTDRQLLLADWYPFIPPFLEGRGWLINPPGDVGEYLSYPLSTFTVTLQISPPDDSLVVGASSPLVEKDGNTYHYQAEDVRNFSFAISPEYTVITKSSNLATVNVFLFPEHADLGERAADLALQAWATFSDLYGTNPRQFMSLVEADITDGLEFDGMFYLSDWYFETADDSPESYFELLTVHETAHQWFYGLVHNDQANEPWLDEAFATYSELLFYEEHHPKLVQWWWNFRVWNYSPTGVVNGSIYDYSESRPYINATYLQGVIFMQALRDRIGDQAFMTFIFRYTQAEENDFRDSAYFFNLLGQVSEDDLSQIIGVYFR